MATLFSYGAIDKEAYARILAHVAMADGVVVKEEYALLEGQLGLILVHPTVREHYRRFIKMQFTVEEVTKGVDRRTLMYALRDSVLMARIDDNFHEAEIESVMGIAAAADVSRERIREIDEWVKQGIRWIHSGDMLSTIPLDEDEPE